MRRVALTALFVLASCATAAASNPVMLSLNFQSQGPIARIYVKPGDHVRAGQQLAQTDAAQARIGVATAEAGVLNARASLMHLTVGLSRAELAQNKVTLAQAKATVRDAIRARADGAASARRTLAQKRRVLAQARQRLAIAQAASVQTVAVLQAAVDTAHTQLATATAGADAEVIRAAQETLTNALNAQAAGTITDRQTIADENAAVANAADDLAAEITTSRTARHQADAAVKTANLAVRATRAANAVAAQRPRPDAFVQARAGLRTAQATLAAARLALAQTDLRAPVAGIVLTVNGHVGEAPGQAAEAGFITLIVVDAAP
jgi:HlyD family secretion protein